MVVTYDLKMIMVKRKMVMAMVAMEMVEMVAMEMVEMVMETVDPTVVVMEEE